MTYYGGKELAEWFRTVRNNTIRVAEDIPEDKYSFKAAPDTRTVEKLLTHIALGSRFAYLIHGVERRTTLEGFNFPAWVQQDGRGGSKPPPKAGGLGVFREEGGERATFL